MTRRNTPEDIFRWVKLASATMCWVWAGTRDAAGYGKIKIGGRMFRAHRVSYQLFKGEIGDYDVLHKCDNPSCINPEHLSLGTHGDNMRDMISKGRRNTKGEKASAAKITNKQAEKIRYDKRSGAVIAAEYGVTKSTINKIRRGATFRVQA